MSDAPTAAVLPNLARRMPQRWSSRLALAGLYLLAGVFLWSGAAKLLDPAAFARAVARFQLLPGFAVSPVAIIVPWLELTLALGLACVPRLRPAATMLSAALLLTFVAALAAAWARGLDVDCGCFGGPSAGGGSVAFAFFRALGLAIVALVVAARLVGQASRLPGFLKQARTPALRPPPKT